MSDLIWESMKTFAAGKSNKMNYRERENGKMIAGYLLLTCNHPKLFHFHFEYSNYTEIRCFSFVGLCDDMVGYDFGGLCFGGIESYCHRWERKKNNKNFE